MSELGSVIVYGVAITGKYGEVDSDIANAIGGIGEKYGLETIWSGREGQHPSIVVIGKSLKTFDENNYNVNLKELANCEERVKDDFPTQQLINNIYNYLVELEVTDINVIEPNTIILHMDA